MGLKNAQNKNKFGDLLKIFEEYYNGTKDNKLN